jgi:hypothetical protein
MKRRIEMELGHELLDQCEEFLELIPNESEDNQLTFEVDNLRQLLEEVCDGWVNISEERLALATQSRLKVIWKLIPEDEKRDTDLLAETYDDLVQFLEPISGYESDSLGDEE